VNQSVSDMLVGAALPHNDWQNSQVDFCVSCVLNHAVFSYFLSTLPNVNNGAIAFLLTDTGSVVAGSNPKINVSDSNNPFAHTMLSRFPNWLQHPNTTETGSVDVDSTNYYLQATVIDTGLSGMRWILVIFTPKSAFEGNVDDNNKTTLILSAVVVCVSIAVTFILVSLINRPMSRVLQFMKTIASHRQDSTSTDDGGTDQPSEPSPLIITPTSLSSTSSSSSSAATPSIAQLDKDNDKDNEVRIDVLSADELSKINEEWQTTKTRTSVLTKIFTSREVKMMHHSFGDMLNQLTKSHLEDLKLSAKRRFLRYIFHEGR
jgi:hypothetical protein